MEEGDAQEDHNNSGWSSKNERHEESQAPFRWPSPSSTKKLGDIGPVNTSVDRGETVEGEGEEPASEQGQEDVRTNSSPRSVNRITDNASDGESKVEKLLGSIGDGARKVSPGKLMPPAVSVGSYCDYTRPRQHTGRSVRSAGGMSGASGRAWKYGTEEKAKQVEALDPVEKELHRARVAGGFTRKSDLALTEEGEVHCNVVTKGRGLPLASLVEEAVEEALGGGAGPPVSFQDNFEGDSRVFHWFWELTYLSVVGSILFALWAYEGRSPSVPDLITLVVSAAGSFGIVARAFCARGYIGVMYRGHVGSGIVDLRVHSASKLDALLGRLGTCKSHGSRRAVLDLAILLIGFPVVLLFALESATTIVRYVFHLIVGGETNRSWVSGTGVLRYRDRVVVIPFMEKRLAGIEPGRTRKIQWPGGALRAYRGGLLDPSRSWALQFSSRDSFLTELGCDRISLQFGTERRLILETGSRTLSFVILVRDGRGGLLLIPVDTSGGVRVRLSALVFSGVAGGVTILMGVEYPQRAPYPEEKVAEALRLKAEPFCLDVSACGIGKAGETGTDVFDVLDGAGAGAVSDECPLWEFLSSAYRSSLAASWATGFFGGHFHTLEEHGPYDEVRVFAGLGHGKRCVISTSSGPAMDFSSFEVVLGVRAHGRGMLKTAVERRGVDRSGRSYQTFQLEGIRGKFCLIPGGHHGEWEFDVDKVAHLSDVKDLPDIARVAELIDAECNECLVA